MDLKNKFRNAFNGLGFFLRSESNAWIHLFFIVAVIFAGFLFSIAVWEWIAVLLCIGAVLAAEAFNSALERMCDLYSKEENPQIKRIKDISAAAVLILSLVAAVVGVLIFLPDILALIAQ